MSDRYLTELIEGKSFINGKGDTVSYDIHYKNRWQEFKKHMNALRSRASQTDKEFMACMDRILKEMHTTEVIVTTRTQVLD